MNSALRGKLFRDSIGIPGYAGRVPSRRFQFIERLAMLWRERDPLEDLFISSCRVNDTVTIAKYIILMAWKRIWQLRSRAERLSVNLVRAVLVREGTHAARDACRAIMHDKTCLRPAMQWARHI